jgi:hypothetical protein
MQKSWRNKSIQQKCSKWAVPNFGAPRSLHLKYQTMSISTWNIPSPFQWFLCFTHHLPIVYTTISSESSLFISVFPTPFNTSYTVHAFQPQCGNHWHKQIKTHMNQTYTVHYRFNVFFIHLHFYYLFHMLYNLWFIHHLYWHRNK